MSSAPLRRGNPAIMARILDRLECKSCPQGLHVMVEELRWMGELSITYEKVLQVVRAELKSCHPRLQRVSEGIYWFADASIPVGWSLYGDRRMLPCFYRKYPPEITWEDIDLPANLLPPPRSAPD